jgi:magnesium-protoporphyrin IX monomethyl ester (oxidative) cyclase
MNWWTAPILARELAQNLLRGQTNFMRGILNYHKVYNVDKILADHSRPVRYELPVSLQPDSSLPKAKGAELYVHAQRDRSTPGIDGSTEQSINATHLGVTG